MKNQCPEQQGAGHGSGWRRMDMTAMSRAGNRPC